LQIDPTWTNFINTNIVAGTNNLTKNGGGNWQGGAESIERIFGGAGYVEWTVDNIVASRKSCGFSFNTSEDDPNRNSYDFGLLQRNDDFIVREFGVNVFTESNLTAVNDIFRIQINNDGTVDYMRNGVVLFTSTQTVRYPLKLDVSIRDTGETLTSVKLHGNWV
jgi:hypothetical protein